MPRLIIGLTFLKSKLNSLFPLNIKSVEIDPKSLKKRTTTGIIEKRSATTYS